MKAPSVILSTLLLVISVSADKKTRSFLFARQTAPSTEKPATNGSGPYPPSGWKPEKPQTSTESGLYPPSGWKPEKPQTSTESAPYPPSGWKPDGPQLEVGPPPKKPTEGITQAPDSENSSPDPSTTDAPAKLVTFVKPENIVYYVSPDGKLQRLVGTPQSKPVVAGAPFQRFAVQTPLELQVIEPIVHVDSLHGSAVYVVNDQLVRVSRNA